jgi:glycine betaine/proline transport system permease protein
MIGAGGLGNTVLTGIQRLDVGLGFEGGLAVVVLAIILDRLTQSLSRPPALGLPRLLPSRAASAAAEIETGLARASA